MPDGGVYTYDARYTAAILPLVNVDKVPDTDCASAIASAEKPPVAAKPAARK